MPVHSQIAYQLWQPCSSFAQGGGIDYPKQPQFGYLLGFIPGAWVCGFLAFQALQTRVSSHLVVLVVY